MSEPLFQDDLRCWQGQSVRLSTVHLGLWPWPGESKELDTWETMVFGGPESIDGMRWRYLSVDLARLGHESGKKAVMQALQTTQRAVELVKRRSRSPLVRDPLERKALRDAAALLERYGLGESEARG